MCTEKHGDTEEYTESDIYRWNKRSADAVKEYSSSINNNHHNIKKRALKSGSRETDDSRPTISSGMSGGAETDDARR
jgi:hypothetical protein